MTIPRLYEDTQATIRRYRFVINYYCKYCQVSEFEQ